MLQKKNLWGLTQQKYISIPHCESMMCVCGAEVGEPMQDPHAGSFHSVGHCSQSWPWERAWGVLHGPFPAAASKGHLSLQWTFPWQVT